MRRTSIAVLGFVLSGALTYAGLCWPRSVRPGWFELDGQPRAVDGEPVQDWQHANEVFARLAVTSCRKLLELHERHAVEQAANDPPGGLDREFTLDYVPAGERDPGRRVIVRQRLPARALWADRHPIHYASYELLDAEPAGPR